MLTFTQVLCFISKPSLYFLVDHNITDDIIDFDGAASGNDDELAKLIVVCMHLTMVLKPCEMIKQKTMMNLSTEDQKVLESILTAIVNDDAVTRARLTEVLQDSGCGMLFDKRLTPVHILYLSALVRIQSLKAHDILYILPNIFDATELASEEISGCKCKFLLLVSAT